MMTDEHEPVDEGIQLQALKNIPGYGISYAEMRKTGGYYTQ